MDAITHAKEGNLKYFKEAPLDTLLKARDPMDDDTVLSMVVYNNRLDCCEVICERCPSLLYHQTSQRGSIPLHSAASSGYLDILKLLIRACNKEDQEGHIAGKQKTLTLTTWNGSNAMHNAVLNHKLEAVKLLVEADPNNELLRAGDDQSNTPLHLAAENSDREIARILIKADPDFRYGANSNGKTPLLIAIDKAERRNADTEMLKLIMELQPTQSMVSVNKNGRRALHYCVSKKYFDTIGYIIQSCPESSKVADKEGRNFFDHAFNLENVEMVQELYKRYPSLIYHQSKGGCTALHHAVWRGETEILKILIAAGAKSYNEYADDDNESGGGVKIPQKMLLTMVDEEGDTALHKAVLNHKFEAVKLLVEADPEYEYDANNSGDTPTMISIREARSNDNKFDSGEIKRLLFQMQPRQTMAYKGDNGGTLLHPAASEGDLSCIEDIIKFCPGILHEVDNDGNAPLHKAVQNHQLRAVKLLVEADPDYEYLENKSGYTPIMISIREARSNDNKFDSGGIKRLLFQMQPRQTMAHRGENGGTLLHPAASEEDLICIEDIIKFCPGILEMVDNDGNAPLHKAVLNHQLRAVKLLVEADPDYEYLENKSGYTPIMISIQEARSNDNKFDSGEIRRLLFQMQPRQTMAHRGENGGTLLHPAASEGDLSCIEDICKFCLGILDVVDNDGNAPLHKAVLNHQLRAVRLLIEADPDYEYLENKSGYTPIMISIQEARSNDNKFDSGEIRRLLFKMQPRQTMAHRGENGGTLLHPAASEGDLRCIEDIIKFCPGILDDVDNDGNAPLHKAVLNNQLQAVKLLVEADPDYEYLENKSGYTPIMISIQEARSNDNKFDSGEIRWLLFQMQPRQTMAYKGDNGGTLLHPAAFEGDLSCIEDIIKFSPGIVNVVDNDGNTPLHKAVLNHQLRAVKLLVEADPDYEYLENKSGYTPIIISIREARSNDNKFDSGEIRRLLFQMQPRQPMAHRGENGGTLLHPAASEGDLSCIQDIIKFCAGNLVVVDNDGNTPLHKAVLNHQLRAVKFLVEADPDYEYLENKSGYTPIMISIREARSNDNKFDSGEIRRLLFKMQPRQTMAHSGEKGWTSLLHQATSEKDLSIIEDVIKFCTGYLDVKDDNGKNFLHIAVELGKIEVVRLVLCAKYISKLTSCLEQLDNEGKNFLHIAAELGKIEVVRLVLRAKDIINLPSCLERLDNEGKNILHIAAEFEKVDIVKQVLRVKDIPKKNILDKKDKDGNTPFHIAALTGNEPLTRRFLFDRRVNKNTVNNDKQHVLSEINFPYDKRKAGVHRIAHTVDQSELKDQSDFDLVVGALIATVSFAAGITVPGGYISDGPNQGTAVFSKRVSFASFTISNTFALVFSLFAVFSHFCARRLSWDADIICLLNVAKFCTLAAMYCMMAAFIAGSFAILAKSNWLAIVVCIICCLFFIFGCGPLWMWMTGMQSKSPASQHILIWFKKCFGLANDGNALVEEGGNALDEEGGNALDEEDGNALVSPKA